MLGQEAGISATGLQSRNGLPVVLISCQVLQDLFRRLLPEGLVHEIRFMDYGLHEAPNKATGVLQEAIDQIEEPSLIVLGYGFCGNVLKGIRARSHTLLVPRVDDCIPLLLGSYAAYRREFAKSPGTYYLSKGWLEAGSHPLSEYREYVSRYGDERAMWLMDQQYQHYERLVLLAQDEADLETYRPQALEVARLCERWGMRYEELLGTDAYVRSLVGAIQSAVDTGAAPAPRVDGDLLVIPPGGEVRLENFLRDMRAGKG